MFLYGFFFFSSRRRHTRSYGDWSSDVCSSDLILHEAGRVGTALLAVSADRAFLLDRPKVFDSELFAGLSLRQQSLDVVQLRSEERRVGKECRSRWWMDH